MSVCKDLRLRSSGVFYWPSACLGQNDACRSAFSFTETHGAHYTKVQAALRRGFHSLEVASRDRPCAHENMKRNRRCSPRFMVPL